ALDINAAGHIVGWATTRADNQGDEQMRAFIYDGGELVPLGPAGARASSAQAINEAGQVIGFSTSYAEYMTAFLWDEQQGLQDLGNLGGDTIIPWGINNAASPVAVGFADDAQSEGVAFVWDAAHGVRDLNALIPADSGWIRLREARGINDAGQIVGYGLRMDGWHAFLLTPVPEPTAALGLLLAASLAMRHRRRA
ncbi:MAG TPA: PEP-CTERM sorting domain-containing protein, partial [Phycisphaerae bacterium]|nr:PEP-CTERM sorting domain-containing protein [Phycisphaerae bacterium]